MMNQPSEATKRKIVEFFMKTSVPRILAKEAEERDRKVAEGKTSKG